jgi:hypothetical protein
MKNHLSAFLVPLAGLLLCSLCISPARAQEQEQIPPAAPRAAAKSWASVLDAPHPRLLGPREYLRARALANPQAYAEIKSPDSVRESIFAAGIANAVEEGGISREQAQPYLDAALAHAKRGATNAHQDSWVWMQEAVLALDFFPKYFSAAQRQEIIGWLNVQLGSFKDDENAFHNSINPKILTYLRVAYATRGENPRADEFRDYALKYLYGERLVPVLRAFGAGGGTTEAGWYARGSLWYLVQALELARRVEGFDGFALAPEFFYGRLALGMFEPYPGQWIYGSERFPMEGDGSYLYGGHSEAGRHTRLILAQYFRGSRWARLAANSIRTSRGSNAPARLVNFLWQEELDEPVSFEGAPLSHYAPGVGQVLARSSWSDDATWLRFNAGDYFSGHQHLDVGNFEIFRRVPLATESGEYIDYSSAHSINYLMRTVAHNCILVFDPDEKFPPRGTFRDGGRVAYANDGGQTKTWEWPVATLEQWQEKRAEFERADIVALEDTGKYLHVAADCTRAYSPAKLKRWVRQVVFLRPHTIVILDRVHSTRAQFEKTWLLHSAAEPILDGQSATISSTEGDKTGRLRVQTLLPRDAKRRSVRGYSYRGQTFDEAKSGQSEAAPQWRLEVLPGVAQEEDVFLHILSTADAPVLASLIQEKNHVGVQVGGTQVLFEAAMAEAPRVEVRVKMN